MVSVDAELPPDGPVELTRVELTTETLYALGRATLDRELGGAREIAIEALRHGSNDIAGRIEAGADTTSISIWGASLDARPYLDGLMHESAPQAGKFVLDFDVERVLTADDRQLTDVRARFETDSEGRHAGFMEGTLETGVHPALLPGAAGGRTPDHRALARRRDRGPHLRHLRQRRRRRPAHGGGAA